MAKPNQPGARYSIQILKMTLLPFTVIVNLFQKHILFDRIRATDWNWLHIKLKAMPKIFFSSPTSHFTISPKKKASKKYLHFFTTSSLSRTAAKYPFIRTIMMAIITAIAFPITSRKKIVSPPINFNIWRASPHHHFSPSLSLKKPAVANQKSHT